MDARTVARGAGAATPPTRQRTAGRCAWSEEGCPLAGVSATSASCLIPPLPTPVADHQKRGHIFIFAQVSIWVVARPPRLEILTFQRWVSCKVLPYTLHFAMFG